MSDRLQYLRSAPVTRALLGYLAALGAVALASVLIGFVLRQVSLANVSVLYLMAVLATAVRFGRGPAVFASFLAFVFFDFLFVEPRYHFTVGNAEEWVSLLVFLLAAVVTGQLAAGQRQQARQAQEREREAAMLYDIVRLMAETELDDALAAVAERLRAELATAAVVVEVWRPSGEQVRVGAGDPEAQRALQVHAAATMHVMQAGRPVGAADHASPGRWVRVVLPSPAHAL